MGVRRRDAVLERGQRRRRGQMRGIGDAPRLHPSGVHRRLVPHRGDWRFVGSRFRPLQARRARLHQHDRRVPRSERGRRVPDRQHHDRSDRDGSRGRSLRLRRDGLPAGRGGPDPGSVPLRMVVLERSLRRHDLHVQLREPAGTDRDLLRGFRRSHRRSRSSKRRTGQAQAGRGRLVECWVLRDQPRRPRSGQQGDGLDQDDRLRRLEK
mmetsp:Transcript_21412/g.50988  ORF Transcript_21412/g.50988 Transcript_21412/m.50988 type:complete len:209 (-) Transcript_21412:701-1327(-)